jgi:hypothetical protein
MIRPTAILPPIWGGAFFPARLFAVYVAACWDERGKVLQPQASPLSEWVPELEGVDYLIGLPDSGGDD